MQLRRAGLHLLRHATTTSKQYGKLHKEIDFAIQRVVEFIVHRFIICIFTAVVCLCDPKAYFASIWCLGCVLVCGFIYIAKMIQFLDVGFIDVVRARRIAPICLGTRH